MFTKIVLQHVKSVKYVINRPRCLWNDTWIDTKIVLQPAESIYVTYTVLEQNNTVRVFAADD
jgi:hypothetical protein